MPTVRHTNGRARKRGASAKSAASFPVVTRHSRRKSAPVCWQSLRQQGKYTIFTSNLTPGNLEVHWRPDGVREGQFHAGVRIVERIREMTEPLQVKSRNLRRER